MAVVGEIVDAIVDGVFKVDRASLPATRSLLLYVMILEVIVLFVPTAS